MAKPFRQAISVKSRPMTTTCELRSQANGTAGFQNRWTKRSKRLVPMQMRRPSTVRDRQSQDPLWRLLATGLRCGLAHRRRPPVRRRELHPDSSLQRQWRVIPSTLSPARIISHLLALTPGTRLGVYEVTAQIGEGGMGQVYRATRHEAEASGRAQDPARRRSRPTPIGSRAFSAKRKCSRR